MQTAVVIAIAAVGVAVLGVLLVMTRSLLRRHVTAFVGAVILACFLLVRMTSLHGVDAVLDLGVSELQVRSGLELVGIGCIAACAWQGARWWRQPYEAPRDG